MLSKCDFEDKIAKLKKLVCTVYYSNSDVTINHIIYFLKKKKRLTGAKASFARMPDGLYNCNSTWFTGDRDTELRWFQEASLWTDDGTSAFGWEWIIVSFRAILCEPRGYRSAVFWAAGFCNPLLDSTTYCVTV